MKESQDKNVPGGGVPGDAGLPGDAAELMRLGLASQEPQSVQPTSAYTHQVKEAGTPTSSADASASAAPHGGSAFVPPTAEKLQRLLPQFQIIELLGRGGMGAVYKARQISLDRIVALKILPPQIVQSPGFAERFTREARALARLNHPNVVAVYDFGQTSNLYYIVMEFVDGTNIRRMIQAGNLKPEEAMAIVPQICEALQFAHNEGIVHRDIKPENILLDKRGRVKIADFGLAKLMEPGSVDYTLTAAGGTMGTPHYMAPEQMGQAHAVDHRADIYSLGVVFYEMLTGELPIGRFAAPSKKVQIDVRLDEVVLRSLEREPDLRYQHVSEVKTDVENISLHGSADTVPIAQENATPAVRRNLEQSRFPLAIKVLALTSVVIVLLSIVGVFTHDVSVDTVLIINASLGIILWVAMLLHSRLQITQARKLGLWPAPGEVPTVEHVNRLSQAGERILAIRLYRQIHRAPLAEARAVVDKLAASPSVQPSRIVADNAKPAARIAVPSAANSGGKGFLVWIKRDSERWWVIGATMALYALSFFLPAAYMSVEKPGTSIEGTAMMGAAVFSRSLAGGYTIWLANPALWAAWILLCFHQRWLAVIAGTTAFVLASSQLFQTDSAFKLQSGYDCWMASTAVIAIGTLFLAVRGWLCNRKSTPHPTSLGGD